MLNGTVVRSNVAAAITLTRAVRFMPVLVLLRLCGGCSLRTLHTGACQDGEGLLLPGSRGQSSIGFVDLQHRLCPWRDHRNLGKSDSGSPRVQRARVASSRCGGSAT